MPQKPKSDKSKGKGFKLKPVAEEPAAAATESSPTREAFENLGDLPHGYGVDTIFLIAQEPHWLFTYWDIDIAKHPGGAATLRYYTDKGMEGEIEVPFETRNWYVPVTHAATEYYVEIGFYRDKKWNVIARSIPVTTPPDGMATAETFDYATIPFHLSFQRLLDNLEKAARSGEDLLTAVSRLQQNGDFSAFGGIGFRDLLSEDQATLIQALMGVELATELSSGAFSSGEIESRLRAFLEEHLSSGGSSELLSSFRDTAGLFSGGAFSSETTTSWSSSEEFSSWFASLSGAETSSILTSWFASLGVGETSSIFASWFTSLGADETSTTFASWFSSLGAGETSTALASWLSALGAGGGSSSAFGSWTQSALTSWSQAATSSWSVGGESSGSLGAMSSWLSGVQSSWAEAALTSWSSAEVSSWFSAATTSSWGGASETLSSFGDSSVTFYGGTDPRLKVTINGQPITLNPDGTFRHHFDLPSEDFRIDIVTEPPRVF